MGNVVKRNVSLRADQVERLQRLARHGNFSGALQMVVDVGLGLMRDQPATAAWHLWGKDLKPSPRPSRGLGASPRKRRTPGRPAG